MSAEWMNQIVAKLVNSIDLILATEFGPVGRLSVDRGKFTSRRLGW